MIQVKLKKNNKKNYRMFFSPNFILNNTFKLVQSKEYIHVKYSIYQW